eukprot:CAMPEP_0172832632 /NCGR_PEP_ID=MMETSP1075-20121228/23800_1 /TAXON_ID=2916 /ORGANISM="Ceratium fusus, Strain PA161109" /LENGTH=330 /DNA_ID=CAMNT_0013675271 /DNA_START=93 /DNA_END=1085 /DNA_ORIENTATION=-
MALFVKFCFFSTLTLVGALVNNDEGNKTHHHHHHRSRNKNVVNSHQAANFSLNKSATSAQAQTRTKVMREQPLRARGKMEVNTPLPSNFARLLARAASDATGCDTKDVTVVSQSPHGRLAEVVFEAPLAVVSAMEHQASDANSKLAGGLLCPFLVEQDADGGIGGQCGPMSALALKYASSQASANTMAPAPAPVTPSSPASAQVQDANAQANASAPAGGMLDMDMDMPFGDLEPFGREDTAQELTESSIHESDSMVDQLERAEVAEEKRAVFRALTRLRGAAITSFDGIARQQTGNIDQYTQSNKWRKQHPVRHLAQQESDYSKWAFPDF